MTIDITKLRDPYNWQDIFGTPKESTNTLQPQSQRNNPFLVTTPSQGAQSPATQAGYQWGSIPQDNTLANLYGNQYSYDTGYPQTTQPQTQQNLGVGGTITGGLNQETGTGSSGGRDEYGEYTIIDGKKYYLGGGTFKPGEVNLNDLPRPKYGGWRLLTDDFSRDLGFVPQDPWQRSTETGAHVIWSPKYGWQDYKTILRMYQQDPNGYATNSWGLTVQNAPDWRTYYNDEFHQPGTDVATGTAGATGTAQPFDWSQLFQYVNPQTGTTPTGTYNANAEVQMPSQWQSASDVLTNFAYGAPTGVPQEWETGINTATQMAQTGMPTNYSDWYTSAKANAQRDIMDAIAQAAEQAGMTGTRWSTPMGRTAQDISGRIMGQLGTDWLAKELAAQEAARARQLEGSSQLYGFGQGITGLEEAAKNRGLSAAGGLTSLGSLMAQYPLDVAQQAMNMGLQMQGAQQTAISPLYTEYLRQVAENNPWLNMAAGVSSLTGQMQPQQYQPSILSQILGAGTTGLGLCSALK